MFGWYDFVVIIRKFSLIVKNRLDRRLPDNRVPFRTVQQLHLCIDEDAEAGPVQLDFFEHLNDFALSELFFT